MYYHLQLTHLFVWDTTGFDDGIPTPNPIVHPVLFNSRAIYTPSEGLKTRPSWLDSPALAHSINSDTTSRPSTGWIVMSLGDFVLK